MDKASAPSSHFPGAGIPSISGTVTNLLKDRGNYTLMSAIENRGC